MDEVEKAIQEQRDLLDSLKSRVNGSVPFIDYDKLNQGTFMSRFYLTNCLEQGWVNSDNPEIQSLILGWAREYPEFMAKMRRQGWLTDNEETRKLALEHACVAPHLYTLHFLLEGWLDPQNQKVRELIILTLNEGNSNIYVSKGWLTQQEADSILDEYPGY